MLSADERLEMPLVLHISDSCVQGLFLQSCGLFSHCDCLAHTQCPQSDNYFPVETLCFWMCPG